MTYSEKLQDPRWQKRRLEVFERDLWTCCDCQSKDKPLHVHHCHYSKGDPWDTPVDFLMALCSECHKERQEHEDRAKAALGFWMRRVTPREIQEFYWNLIETTHVYEGVIFKN